MRLGCGARAQHRLLLTALAAWLLTACASDDEIAPGDMAKRVPGATFRDCSDCPEMVVIGPGRFQMGAAGGEDDRKKRLEWTYHSPPHPVAIQYAFALGKYDVTRAEFSVFARETGYRVAGDCYGYTSDPDPVLTWQDPGFPQTDRDPVVCVSWPDAQAYLAWLSQKTRQRYRLPSEAEWEYAARAGTSTTRYWGDGIADTCQYADVADRTLYDQWDPEPAPGQVFDCSDGYVHTSPVGSFLPNQFGLYDMLGNVLQWTEDCWHFSYEGAPSDGSAWLRDTFFPGKCSVFRTGRGSTFTSLPNRVRAAYRLALPAALHMTRIGFRVARD